MKEDSVLNIDFAEAEKRVACIEGKDIHKETAAIIYGVKEDEVTPEMRRVGKTINQGSIYVVEGK